MKCACCRAESADMLCPACAKSYAKSIRDTNNPDITDVIEWAANRARRLKRKTRT